MSRRSRRRERYYREGSDDAFTVRRGEPYKQGSNDWQDFPSADSDLDFSSLPPTSYWSPSEALDVASGSLERDVIASWLSPPSVEAPDVPRASVFEPRPAPRVVPARAPFPLQRLMVAEPDRAAVCIRRKIRREVIFAKTGGGRGMPPRKRDEDSKVGC